MIPPIAAAAVIGDRGSGGPNPRRGHRLGQGELLGLGYRIGARIVRRQVDHGLISKYRRAA